MVHKVHPLAMACEEASEAPTPDSILSRDIQREKNKADCILCCSYYIQNAQGCKEKGEGGQPKGKGGEYGE